MTATYTPPTAPPQDAPQLRDEPAPALEALRAMWGARWRIAVGGLVGLLAFVALSLVLPKRYAARTTFTPEVSAGGLGAGGLAGLAGLAGIAGSLGMGNSALASMSPEFFVELLGSREVQLATLQTRFPDPEAADTTIRKPLIDILGVTDERPRRRIDKALRKLGKRVEASVDRRTGVVALQVQMASPELAAAVANRMVALVNEFNLSRRQTQSRAQREFLEQRLSTARTELRQAESAQLSFLTSNRSYQGAPVLAAQAARLERDVGAKQEVFLSLNKAYEEARIAEVRDTPLLSVIDPATPPSKPASPDIVLNAISGMVLALLLAALAVGVPAYRRAVAAAPAR